MYDLDEFVTKAENRGFTEEQARFMFEYLAQQGHGHDIDDVAGLEEVLEDIEGESEEEEEEED